MQGTAPTAWVGCHCWQPSGPFTGLSAAGGIRPGIHALSFPTSTPCSHSLFGKKVYEHKYNNRCTFGVANDRSGDRVRSRGRDWG